MKKYLILTIIVIVGVAIGFSDVKAQSVQETSISADEQSDLPVYTSSYDPCCGHISYVFEFDIEQETSQITNARVHPRVVTSDLDIYVDSWRYSIGTDWQVTGSDIATGGGNDVARIDGQIGNEPDVFSNMDFDVLYYDIEPD